MDLIFSLLCLNEINGARNKRHPSALCPLDPSQMCTCDESRADIRRLCCYESVCAEAGRTGTPTMQCVAKIQNGGYAIPLLSILFSQISHSFLDGDEGLPGCHSGGAG